jgi:hypothetical protein
MEEKSEKLIWIWTLMNLGLKIGIGHPPISYGYANKIKNGFCYKIQI